MFAPLGVGGGHCWARISGKVSSNSAYWGTFQDGFRLVDVLGRGNLLSKTQWPNGEDVAHLIILPLLVGMLSSTDSRFTSCLGRPTYLDVLVFWRRFREPERWRARAAVRRRTAWSGPTVTVWSRMLYAPRPTRRSRTSFPHTSPPKVHAVTLTQVARTHDGSQSIPPFWPRCRVFPGEGVF